MLIEGKAALGYARIETSFCKLTLAPGSSKKSPLILNPFWVNNKRASKAGLSENHDKE
jgi:hypothetical protein